MKTYMAPLVHGNCRWEWQQVLWNEMPRGIDVADARIHVFLFPLSTMDIPALIPLLSQEEKSRIGAITNLKKAREYAAARATLRWLLALCTGMPSEEVAVLYAPNTPPTFVPPDASVPRIGCGISHSRDMLLITLSTTPSGVDVEVLREPDNFPQIVSRMFPETWRAQIYDAATAAERTRLFTRCWTAIESLLKMTGARSLREMAAHPPHVDGAGLHFLADDTHIASLLAPSPVCDAVFYRVPSDFNDCRF